MPIGKKFRFQAQDSFLEYLFGELKKNHLYLLDSIFQYLNCKAGKEKVTAQVSCYKFSSWKLEKFEWDPLAKLFFFNIQALREVRAIGVLAFTFYILILHIVR